MINDDYEKEIFRQIDKYGIFLMSPEYFEYNDTVHKLEAENRIICCDKLPATKGFFNESYHFTYYDNRYNVEVKRKGKLSWIGKENDNE